VGSDLVLYIVVATALAFDFTNGFHDTANAVATSISTRALAPRTAVAIASLLNFVGAFISLEVAATVASGIVEAGAITPTVVFAGLVGAIAWNLGTWWFGLPSSSSHALIGGVVGATFAAAGSGAVQFDGIVSKVLIPALLSPILAGLVAAAGVFLVYRIIRRYAAERAEREFRWAQVASSSMVALAHGTNDAQKTMGVIWLTSFASSRRPTPTGRPDGERLREAGSALLGRPGWEGRAGRGVGGGSVARVDREPGFGCRLDELHDVGWVGDHREMP